MTKTYDISYNARNYGYDIFLSGKRVANTHTLWEAIAYAANRNCAYNVINRR
jgi:hypothetical protein